MNFIREEMHDAQVVRSASLPQVADGADYKPTKYEVRERANGMYAIFRDNCYVRSTGTRDKELALDIKDLFKKQDEAKNKKIVDARFALASEVVDYRKRTYRKKEGKSYAVITSTFKPLDPYLEGRQLIDLDGDWLLATEEGMLADGYDYGYFYNCIAKLITAINVYCKSKLCSSAVAFPRPEAPEGRDRVLFPFERDRILRWADGTEDYHPETDTWLPASKPLTKAEANRRLMVGRAVRLGLPLGSRPGRYAGMAWKGHLGTGHIDVAGATMYRWPLGVSKKNRKEAPPVALSPELLAIVAGWQEADVGQLYVFRNSFGDPLSQKALEDYFAEAMRLLGIEGVTGHTLRHTCITRMIEKGLSASVISSIVGISIFMLKRRYDHSDERVVQVIGHSVMDQMLH
ncbi:MULTISPECIES: tyrosine-type recombinase/integrase [unclassified Bradyrhizobium]|uniref:tyrosine-type recombinase/integrase n=1 Tax=unclassified Bradyrhizobium TaxID=2631580 RepID=UPI001FFAD6C1|nr:MULTISPECIES: tyrosine-type recombinase/integrase [unclassified Bradyrhizobium]MCK1270834.1 tyrosine-type recombinase/integrase [Bradyrhizobium sp. 84]MCK1372141.1 tyrosine-type recombinase/integrase [Bradyrhizobium sp. 49]MCK1417614.1 tyrosine-type recombinase/integrase [Bradyrhizobium sp. CW4]MCK1430588.1 tyrosine-type recombinase/integrase [Bradyrhizobium sp. 87]